MTHAARDLVYGAVAGSLVFIPRDQAEELAIIWTALGSASTWGEYRSLVPRRRYEEILALVPAEDKPPSDDDPFPGYDLPPVADGDYPEWCAQEMLKWVPSKLVSQPHGRIENSVHNGRFLVLAPEHEDEIVAVFVAAGFRCSRDQELVSRATGHEPPGVPEGSVPELILAFMSRNSQVRSAAIDALQEIGVPAAPALTHALKHPSDSIRSGAALTLGRVRPASGATIMALVDALRDESVDVCRSASEALEAIGPEAASAVPALAEAMGHPSVAVRAGACRALGGIGPRASVAVPVLIQQLRDPDTLWQAMGALSRIVPNFARKLQDDARAFNHILDGDVFANHLCARCGMHGALFATPRMFTACPKCLAERIRSLRKGGVELPVWASYLEGVADEAVAQQAKAHHAALSVSFDDFYRCARCDALVRAADARYYVPAGGNSSPPYCVQCYEVVRRGE